MTRGTSDPTIIIGNVKAKIVRPDPNRPSEGFFRFNVRSAYNQLDTSNLSSVADHRNSFESLYEAKLESMKFL